MGFKAESFLGFFTIRNGCLVGCVLQALAGVLVWSGLGYLRPMLQYFSDFLLIYFVAGAILGLYAILTRSELLTWIYLIQLGSCASMLIFLVLDFAGFLPILPKPPVAPSEPIIPPVVKTLEKLEQDVIEGVTGGKTHSTLAPASAASTGIGVFGTSGLRFRGKLLDPSVDLLKLSHYFDPLNPSFSIQKTRMGASGPVAGDEVAKNELPPEVASMPLDLKKCVSATTKVVKHVVRFCFAGVFAFLAVVLIYCSYITISFALNKCVSLDELSTQPDQFSPIIPESSSSFGNSENDEVSVPLIPPQVA